MEVQRQKMTDIASSTPVPKNAMVSRGRKLSRKKVSLLTRLNRLSLMNLRASITLFSHTKSDSIPFKSLLKSEMRAILFVSRTPSYCWLSTDGSRLSLMSVSWLTYSSDCCMNDPFNADTIMKIFSKA